MPIQPCLLVPLDKVESVWDSLVDLQALNANYVPVRIGDRLAIPIHEEIGLNGLDANYDKEHIEVEQAPPPIDPHHRMQHTIQSMIGFKDELLASIPKKWERLNDLVLFQKDAFQGDDWEQVLSQNDDFFHRIADALNVKRIGRQQPISNDVMRSAQAELLHGNDGWVEVKDNGVFYGFDATKVMYSSGNVTERRRMGALQADGEIVIDAYAGIGYYTMQLLVHTNVEHIHACEINPNSIRALEWSSQQNEVESRLTIHPQDNLITLEKMKEAADRILLGYLPSSEATWRLAVQALKQSGGTLHIHMNVEEERIDGWIAETIDKCLDYAQEFGREWRVTANHLEKVKWYAPRVRHVVLDVSFSSINSAS